MALLYVTTLSHVERRSTDGVLTSKFVQLVTRQPIPPNQTLRKPLSLSLGRRVGHPFTCTTPVVTPAVRRKTRRLR